MEREFIKKNDERVINSFTEFSGRITSVIFWPKSFIEYWYVFLAYSNYSPLEFLCYVNFGTEFKFSKVIGNSQETQIKR